MIKFDFEMNIFGSKTTIKHTAILTSKGDDENKDEKKIKMITKRLYLESYILKNFLFEIRVSFNDSKNEYVVGYVNNKLVPIKQKNFVVVREKMIESIKVVIYDNNLNKYICTGYCVLYFS